MRRGGETLLLRTQTKTRFWFTLNCLMDISPVLGIWERKLKIPISQRKPVSFWEGLAFERQNNEVVCAMFGLGMWKVGKRRSFGEKGQMWRGHVMWGRGQGIGGRDPYHEMRDEMVWGMDVGVVPTSHFPHRHILDRTEVMGVGFGSDHQNLKCWVLGVSCCLQPWLSSL